MNEKIQTWYGRENRKKSTSALMMVVLMLLSTQMYNFIGAEEAETSLEGPEETPARTAYQQFYQSGGASAGETQGQPASTADSQPSLMRIGSIQPHTKARSPTPPFS